MMTIEQWIWLWILVCCFLILKYTYYKQKKYLFDDFFEYTKRRVLKRVFRRLQYRWSLIWKKDDIWYQFTNSLKSISSWQFFDEVNKRLLYFITLPYWFSLKNDYHKFILCHESWHIVIFQNCNSFIWLYLRFISQYWFLISWIWIPLTLILLFVFKYTWIEVVWMIYQIVKIITIIFYLIVTLWLVIEEIYANIRWYQLWKETCFEWEYILSLEKKKFIKYSLYWLFSYVFLFLLGIFSWCILFYL